VTDLKGRLVKSRFDVILDFGPHSSLYRFGMLIFALINGVLSSFAHPILVRGYF
jgi:hypothetical protein